MGFNVPFAQADASLRAVRAAEAMLHRFAAVAEQWHQHYGLEVGLGIGINRGEAVVGNVGSPTYMNDTVIGDEVNVASRLKDRARAGEILFTTPVRAGLTGSEFESRARALPPITLKGKLRPVQIHSVTVTQRAYYRVA